MQPSNNGFNKDSAHKTFVSEGVLKSYLLLERRALLQCVHADERLLTDISSVLDKLSVIESEQNKDVVEIVRSCATMLSRNTEERRKAILQIVRDTEKRYGIASLSDERRAKRNRFFYEKRLEAKRQPIQDK